MSSKTQIKAIVKLTISVGFLFSVVWFSFHQPWAKHKKPKPKVSYEFLWTSWIEGTKGDPVLNYGMAKYLYKSSKEFHLNDDGDTIQDGIKLDTLVFIPKDDSVYKDSAGRKIHIRDQTGQDSIVTAYFLWDRQFIRDTWWNHYFTKEPPSKFIFK
jgi:hypothetical protein